MITRRTNIREKIIASCLSTIIFFFVSYGFSLIPNRDFFSLWSNILRSLIILALLRLGMFLNTRDVSKVAVTESDKLIVSFMGVVIYLILSSKVVYGLTNIIGSRIGLPTMMTRNEKPSLTGILLHSIIYGIVVYLFMR